MGKGEFSVQVVLMWVKLTSSNVLAECGLCIDGSWLAQQVWVKSRE
jgi:hypothetical protein